MSSIKRFAFIVFTALLITCCEQAEYVSFENDCNCETQVYAQNNVTFNLKQNDKNDAYQATKFDILPQEV